MFLRKDSPNAYDSVMMRFVHQMEQDKKNETYRESMRGKVKYPPNSGGHKNGIADKIRPLFGTDGMGASKAHKNETAPAGMFNPVAKLDTSQVQDMRNAPPPPMNPMMGSMMGNGTLERPAPGDTMGQEAPAGMSPQMLQMLQMLMQKRKMGMMGGQ